MHKRIWLTALLASFSTLVCAKVGNWIQTYSGQDSDGTSASLHTEYVLSSSIRVLRGNHRQAFIKVTYAPGVELPFSGDVETFEIAQVEVGCSDLSWGVVTSTHFTQDMKPIMAETGAYDQSKPIWSLKGMKALDPKEPSYKTAEYICRDQH